MSIGFTSVKGLTFYERERAFAGVTVFAPMEGTGVWMIDMLGRFVKYWEMGYKPGCYGELLPNGNLLYAGKVADGPLSDLEGAGGVLLEVDWDGKVVWEYRDPYLHHAFYRMKNGNTLVLKWVKVPKDIVAKVTGGDPGTERDGIMWGDAIQEITPEGEVAWEWIGHEHLAPEDNRCLLCPRSTWTHANGLAEMPDGNVLACFMLMNTLAIVDKKSGNIKWRWGWRELAHPHCPSVLDNGNILVFDNGFHPLGMPTGASRVVEVDPSNSKMVWSYGATGITQFFYASAMSSCQRLPNRNTFICEGTWGRLFEVAPNGELAWEYVNNLPSCETAPIKSKSCPVYAAFRYGMDYSGLKRPIPVVEARQAAPGTRVRPAREEAVRSRLEALGY